MSRTLTALAMALGLLVAGVVVPATASAAPADGKRVCPTEDFWVGAGWGADRGRRTHKGLDLGGKRGTPIYAVEKGVIDRTKKQSNGALQIVLKGRSGAKYYYGHMDKVLIKGGQRVKAGQVIGLMGDTGSPGAVHLHFEFWRSGRESAAVDPEPLIERICSVGKAGAGSEPESTPAPEPTEAPPPEDPAVVGDVFIN